jgi:hypothetical protein
MINEIDLEKERAEELKKTNNPEVPKVSNQTNESPVKSNR